MTVPVPPQVTALIKSAREAAAKEQGTHRKPTHLSKTLLALCAALEAAYTTPEADGGITGLFALHGLDERGRKVGSAPSGRGRNTVSGSMSVPPVVVGREQTSIEDLIDDLHESAAQSYDALSQATIDVLLRAATILASLPSALPTKPTTEGGVWGSYVEYLAALEARAGAFPLAADVTPKQIAAAIESTAVHDPDGPDFYSPMKAATAVLALLTTTERKN